MWRPCILDTAILTDGGALEKAVEIETQGTVYEVGVPTISI
jgi:hypothetical protein